MPNTVLIPFHGNKLITTKVKDIAYVAMRPIVEEIGLEWARQAKKLSQAKFNCVHMYTTGADGKQHNMLCMPIKKLNGWLFSINPEKVKSDIKPTLIRYQEECFTALYDYWHKGIAIKSKSWVRERSEAAKNYSTMGEILRLSRLEQGKATGKHHYTNEARLINGIITGQFKGRNRDQLSKEDLRIISSLEAMNIILLARGIGYKDRKERLILHYQIQGYDPVIDKGVKNALR